MIPVGLSSKSMFMKVPATSDYYEDLNNWETHHKN